MSFEQINDDVRICFDWKEGITIVVSHRRGYQQSTLSPSEARELAVNLVDMADKLDPENREIYPVDAYTLDVYKREADEALEKAHVWHPCNPELDHENNEIYKAKLAEIGRWILGYSKDAAK